jgi:hypothetical protein
MTIPMTAKRRPPLLLAGLLLCISTAAAQGIPVSPYPIVVSSPKSGEWHAVGSTGA